MGKIKNWVNKILSGTFKKKIHRDSTTGKFVSDEFVEQNPATTTTEIREVTKRKK